MASDNQPLVSVIIPNYNHAKYLDERMQSVLGQTYQNIEVIILDDCSTDNSREVIEQYRDNPKVAKIVYNDKNTGKPFQQWNKGIELATGDIIWIAESDDTCDIHLLERLVKLYVENDCVICFCRLILTYENGGFYRTGQGGISSDNIEHVWKGKDFIKEQLCFGNVIANASGVIFSKEAALKVDHGYERYRGSGDWLFWIEMAELGNVGFDSRAMNYFRQHGNNTTKIMYSNGTDMIEDHKIWLYLKDHQLISDHIAWRIQKQRILWHMGFNFDTEATRRKVQKVWGYNNPIVKLRILLFKIFYSLSYRI